jgi:hypothetical protein
MLNSNSFDQKDSDSNLKIKCLNYLNASLLKRNITGQAPVAHAYNPSYSEGRDQEDHSLKPA